MQVIELKSRNNRPRKASAQPDLIPVDHDAAASAKGGITRLENGLFITFEGGEGAGKTTQASRLADRLADLGIEVHNTREPGGTQLGEQIRTWVKRESDISTVAETLLFAAARAQLVSTVLKPKLSRGSVVIVDRFIDSTVAYQGYGRGMNIGQIETINQIATGGIVPDLTVFLNAEPEAILDRIQITGSLFNGSADTPRLRKGDSEDGRRFEREPISFHKKVREGYRQLSREGQRWSVIRADQAPHRVADAIWKRVRPLLVERGVDAELLTRKQGVQSGTGS